MKKILLFALLVLTVNLVNAEDAATTDTSGLTGVAWDTAKNYANQAYGTLQKAFSGTDEEKAQAKSQLTDTWTTVKNWFSDMWQKAKDKSSEMMEQKPKTEDTAADIQA